MGGSNRAMTSFLCLFLVDVYFLLLYFTGLSPPLHYQLSIWSLFPVVYIVLSVILSIGALLKC